MRAAAGGGHRGLGRRDQAGQRAAATRSRAPGRQARRRSRRRSFGDQEGAHARRRSTSLATKASPMPRARMKVSAPPSAFLSWRHVGDQARRRRTGAPATSVQPGRQAGGGDGPARRASASSAGHRPERGGEAEGQGAAGATASPCSRAVAVAGLGLQRVAEGVAEVEQGAAARLASRPRRRSRPSSPPSGRRRGPGPRARAPAPPAPLASSQSKKARSPSRPYLITSA